MTLPGVQDVSLEPGSPRGAMSKAPALSPPLAVVPSPFGLFVRVPPTVTMVGGQKTPSRAGETLQPIQRLEG